MNKVNYGFQLIKSIQHCLIIIILLSGMLWIESLITCPEGLAQTEKAGTNNKNKGNSTRHLNNSSATKQTEQIPKETTTVSTKPDRVPPKSEDNKAFDLDFSKLQKSGATGVDMSNLFSIILLVLLVMSLGINIYFLLGGKPLRKNADRFRDSRYQPHKNLPPRKYVKKQDFTKFMKGTKKTTELSPNRYVIPTQKREEIKEEDKVRKPPLSPEEMTRMCIQKYNEALLGNKERRENFMDAYEHEKVSILNPEEMKKGDYVDANFKPEFGPNEHGDLLLVKIDYKSFIFPTFDMDIFHYYSLKSCFDLEKSDTASMQKTMVQEVIEPAKCQQESSGTWKLKERGKVVIQQT